jgi:diguanylate cyclase (GGDEF)-like protein
MNASTASPRMRLRPAAGSANFRSVIAALAVAGALLTALQFIASRRQLIEDVRAQAHVVGLNSAAALLFDDSETGSETLRALRPLPHLEAAALFTSEGRRLSEYRREGARAIRALPESEYQGDFDGFVLADPVVLDGRIVGHVAMRSGFGRLYRSLLVFAGLFVLAGAGALAVSYPVVRRMRREVRRAEAQLDRLAHFDPVTGQLNRHAFNGHLQLMGARLREEPNSQMALIILDLDNFKVVNDTLGHHFGDELLKQVAQRLFDVLRRSDAIFRIGGDELAITLYPLSSSMEVIAVAERIMGAFRQPFALGTHEVYASASCGISIFPDDTTDLKALASNADAAMYRAKRNGKNSFELFRSEMNEEMQRRHRIQSDLRRAIDDDELLLHYQPQVDPGTLQVVGVEALVRWRHPDLGWVPASEIVSIAEESGLVIPMGRWVVRQAARQAQAWRELGIAGLSLALNVSARQSRDEGFVDYIATVLERTGGAPELLELEITESLLLDDTDRNVRFIQRIRDKGIRLAIDDFGTGYSSLAYLQRLPIGKLKIDMSFVRAIPGDGEPITTAILAMAHSLGLTVVAEGVENAQQLEFLRRAGCDAVQGHLISRPMPAGELTAFLQQHARPQPGTSDDSASALLASEEATAPLARSRRLQ